MMFEWLRAAADARQPLILPPRSIRRRARVRALAHRLRVLADRIEPEPLYTFQLTTVAGTETFIDCRRRDRRPYGEAR